MPSMQLLEYTKEKLFAKDYENLHNLMEITKTRRTQILNDPPRMTQDEIIQLARLLDVLPTTLISQFNCGESKITVKKNKELMELKEV
ncbi:MAG: hypothetical protein K8S00_09870 [Bacteroidales bacterium]|nr:hypothetical protein [Bacteroidales bacterium]